MAVAVAVRVPGSVGVPSGGGLSVAKTAHKAGGGTFETQIYKKPEVMFNRRAK